MGRNAEIVEKKEPVDIYWTTDIKEEDKVATKTTTHSTFPNHDLVKVVTLSSDTGKENRVPEYKQNDIDISEKQTLASPSRNESNPANENLKIKPILEPIFTDSTDADNNFPLLLL